MSMQKEWFNSLPNNKILDRSKFKALTDDKINMIQNLNFGLGWVKTFLEKASIFSFSQNVFKSLLIHKSLIIWTVW